MLQTNSDNQLHVVPNASKKPVFYKLDNKEWLSVAKKLTHSELLVLYHLRTLEPFGERSTSSTTKAVAEAVGISQRSVQRALIKLAAIKLIDLRFQKFDFSLRTKFTDDDEQEEDTEEATAVSFSDNRVANQEDDTAVKEATAVSPIGQACRQSVSAVAEKTALSDSSLETYTPRDFSPSKTNKTYKTNQTLSEATRERNLLLWKKFDGGTQSQIRYYAHQVALPKLPIKPTLPDVWITCHCEEIFNQMMRDTQFQKQWEEFSANSPAVENEDAVDW